MVNLALEFVLSRNMRHLSISTCTNCSNDAFESSQRRVVDDPAAIGVLIDFLDSSIETGFRFERVFLPKLRDLGYDLLAVGIAVVPVDGGVEAVHYRVDL